MSPEGCPCEHGHSPTLTAMPPARAFPVAIVMDPEAAVVDEPERRVTFPLEPSAMASAVATSSGRSLEPTPTPERTTTRPPSPNKAFDSPAGTTTSPATALALAPTTA